MEPSNIQAVLALNFDHWGVAPIREVPIEPFLGKGLFTSDGKYWEHSRSLLKPIFGRAQISDFSYLEEHTKRLIKLIPSDGSTEDLQPLFKRLFLDVSTQFIFGESLNSLLSDSGNTGINAVHFLAAFDKAMIGIRVKKDLEILRWLRSDDENWKNACSEVHAFVDEYVRKGVKRKERTPVGDNDELRQLPISLLDELLEETNDRRNIRNQLLDIFSAARDTTAVAPSNVFFNLARHPQVWKKLGHEVSSAPENLTFELLKSMKYLQFVVKEST
ncbi:hypothetical protein MMC25_005782 [Agyrium rufum]|nr:hypothetical protein [Agyrium rufum]